MKKSNFIKSTILLIVGGFFTKVLSMVIKIVLTRLIKTEGIGLYMLITPTFMLVCSISNMGLQTAISKLVAEDKYNNKNLVLGLIPVILIINLLLMFILIFSAKFIAFNLLKEPKTYYGILACALVIPFISISTILRGYFFGKQRIVIHIITNIIEDLVRLFLFVIFIPKLLPYGLSLTIGFVIATTILSELSSIIIFTIFLPKKVHINDFKPVKNNILNIFSISLPTTGSRLIGNIGYFLEPIILTFVLTSIGYSNNFIVLEYGIITGYVMPLLLIPSFFSSAISQALIPIISHSYSKKNYTYVKSKIKQGIFFCLLIGIPATLIFLFIPEIPLKLIYDTDLGINYIRFLAVITIFHYIQAPISASLQAMGKASLAMKGTLFGMIFKLLTLFLLSYLKIGLWGLIISISINMIFVTLYQVINVLKALKNS